MGDAGASGPAGSASPHRLRLERALGASFRVGRLLGAGGFAEVYEATDLQLKRPVAIKVLHPELVAAPGLVERFLREAQAIAKLRHAHIIPIYQVGQSEGLAYFVMPLIAGESLREYLAREGRPPIETSRRILREVAGALTEAHTAGIVHRDIKPDNIMLEGAAQRVVVTDFGIAKAVGGGESRLTATGMVVGTPDYMSPEQATGGRDIGPSSDQYSLGVVGYQMLAGRLPFVGPSAQAVIAQHITETVVPVRSSQADVPANLATAVERALEKDPAARWDSCAAFIAALDAPEESATRWRPRRAARRKPAAASWSRGRVLRAGAAVAALAITGLFVAALRRPRVDPQLSMVAVMPLIPSSPDSALVHLGRELVTTVSATLDGVAGVRTVDRFAVLKATSGKALSLDQTAGLSRRLGAGSFVFGSVHPVGDQVRLDVGLYRSSSSEPVGPSLVVEAPRESLTVLSDSMTRGLLTRMWATGRPPSASLGAATTRSLSALKDYIEGESDLAADHPELASDAFARAAHADSTFWLAKWRYNETQGGMDKDDDTTFSRDYLAHLEVFSARDRGIIEAENTMGVVPFERHVAMMRAVTEEYPLDWTPWSFLADHLTHLGPLTGHSIEEARAAWDHVVAIDSDLASAWQHLLWEVSGRDSVAARRAWLNWSRLKGRSPESGDWSVLDGPDGIHPLVLRLQRQGGRLRGPLADSVARAVARSTSIWGQGVSIGLMVYGFPAAGTDANHLIPHYAHTAQWDAARERATGLIWVARGAWDSALVALDTYAHDFPDRPSQGTIYELATIGAWLGGVDVADAAARRAAAIAQASQRAQDSAYQASVAYSDGLLATVRRDAPGVVRARQALERLGTSRAAFLQRSLAALALGLNGRSRAAAESLAVIDERATERDLGSVGRDPYAVSVNHLAAAEALLAQGDSARAARQLVWHEANVVSGGDVIIHRLFAGLAYYRLARIEEGMGRRAEARVHYQQFLQRWDSPVPSQQQWVDEARRALLRLGGTT